MRVRDDPGVDKNIFTLVPEGSKLFVEDNPECADQTWWWRVLIGDRPGYVAEADPEEYLLEPVR